MARFARTVVRVTDILAARKAAGATTDEMADELGLHINHVGGALALMGKSGAVAWHVIASGMCHNKRRWYLPEHKPAEPPLQPATNVRIDAPKPVKKAAGPVLVQCPNYEDRRFRFDPPPGWVGEITRDWQERRLQEAQ